MPNSQSIYTTRRGEFRQIFRALARRPDVRKRTPVIFCEGDSWFSTPLTMNILDWLVYPPQEVEAKGVPIHGQGGLFFRAEKSGDLATKMFALRRLEDIMGWYGGFDFDIALLSGGGNDFVDEFLRATFKNESKMTVNNAFDRVVSTGRFEEVFKAYERALTEMIKRRPQTPIIAHSYCYPLKLGVPADLTVANLGVAALLKKNTGPWIGRQMNKILPKIEDQRLFARKLIDGFVERVLERLAVDGRFKSKFQFIDLRDEAPLEQDWFDEMHPTGRTFQRLSQRFARQINSLLSVQ